MTKIVTNLGLQTVLDRYIAGLLSGCVDDSTTAITSTTTTLGSPTNLFAVALDSVTLSGQTITITFTIPAASGNFTNRRLTVHNVAAGSVTGTSASLQLADYGLSNAKNSSIAINYIIQATLS